MSATRQAVSPSAPADSAAPVLRTIGLNRHFGGLHATREVNLALPRGERHALIGPNGAGKTTLINLLTGVLRPSSGRILLEGEDVTALRSDQRVGRGLVRTFQINQLFPAMTVLETVGLAVSQRLVGGRAWWRPVGSRPAVVEETVAVLERFRLGAVLGERVANLPYGQQRLLEIALAIACRPRVLLLDEPAAGVPEAEREEILHRVAELPEDVTVLLIEHDMDLVFRFAHRISVLVQGGVLTEGTAAEVAADPRVRAVYLGEGGHG
ncbi:ABC transporter ATP-binding protein [Roseomonas sp. OT10]|uniref:ABC transporter ATP-binding protein n=1 Tax=Roseomonas cutis TaxID=2897332 RepID=UPI001E2EB8B9|nr:ABC transporter ATP-binding protein [Roseomonas sp. OT10]UFN47193.1 ABC transporter ATP-binding protein [Roseomonas sp. OT10]